MNRPLRRLHPAAWWIWALFLAAAASRTTDVLLLLIIIAVAGLMVYTHGAPGGGRVFRIYVLVALFVLTVRVVFRIVIGGGGVGEVALNLPELSVPDWATGIRIGGAVTWNEIVMGLTDGMRLGTLIICVGAANALADPRRMLRSLPRALHSIGTAVVVAIGLAPQLVASTLRIRRASALRSVKSRRLRLRRLLAPVIDDAMDRTLALALAMETRGFGRPLGQRSGWVFALSAGGMLLVALGVFLLLDGSAGSRPGVLMLAGGLVAAAIGLRAAGRHRSVTTYRPEQWRAHEWGVALVGFGVFAAITLIGGLDPGSLHPSGVPQPPLLATLAVLIAASPVLFAPTGAPSSRAARLRPS